ncbi:MAG: rubredoxin-like domain-containing protein, partial [Promethearchaeota archaeon]
ENATTFGTTIINLESLIQEEEDNWQKLYPNYANTAEMEGYKKIAKKLKNLANIKKNRSQRLKMFLNLINTDDFSEKVAITLWTCMACGYEIAINELPKDYICPTCGHNISYFQKKTLQLIHDDESYQRTKRSRWVCMECGYKVALEQLPDDWKCVSCGRSKEYFKRITLKPIDNGIQTLKLEKAHWICLVCGNEEDIEMPADWKCPKCGSPK